MSSRTSVSLLDSLEGETVGAGDGSGKDAIGPALALVGVGVEVCRPAVVVVEAVASGVDDVAALAIPAWNPLPGASGQFVHVQLASLGRRCAEDQQHRQGSDRCNEKLASMGHDNLQGKERSTEYVTQKIFV